MIGLHEFDLSNRAGGTDKLTNLSLMSKLNVKHKKLKLKRLKNLLKIANKVKSHKTKKIIIKLGKDLKYLRKRVNKKQKAVNGNIRNVKKSIKILGWNKGGFELISKIDEIKLILQQKKPDVFIVNELNLYKNDDQNLCNMEGYNFEHDNLLKTRGVSRTGMWIADNLVYKRIKKSENLGESVVIIKIGYPNQRKFNLIGFYRQWSKTFNRIPFQPLSIKEQEENFRNQMDKIKMISDIETIVLGDFNIDYNLFSKKEAEKINYEKTFKERLNIISDKLLANNFFQLIKENTRTDKILDHIYYNNMNKLIKANVLHDSSTDHKFIVAGEKDESECSRGKISFLQKYERY